MIVDQIKNLLSQCNMVSVSDYQIEEGNILGGEYKEVNMYPKYAISGTELKQIEDACKELKSLMFYCDVNKGKLVIISTFKNSTTN